MAKAKTTAIAVPVMDHGPCADCEKTVDVVVETWQLAGPNRFRCVECREKRLKEKYNADVGALKEKAAAAREDAAQSRLEFPAE